MLERPKIPELFTASEQPQLYGCEHCKDFGYVVCDASEAFIKDDKSFYNHNGEYIENIVYLKKCKCTIAAEFKRKMEASGLHGVANLTFKDYKTRFEWQKAYLKTAREFREKPSDAFFMSGSKGSGKTLLCSTLFKYLIYDGRKGIYMIWDEEMSKATDNYRSIDYTLLERWKKSDVLYIDDFLKCINNDISQLTEMEKMAARTIINSRYNRDNKITIISTELTDVQLSKIDGSLWGRITEMATRKNLIVMNPNEDRDIRAMMLKGTWNEEENIT